MHRIDGPGAAPGNLFTEGNPGTGVPATDVTDDWCNAVQEEICAVVTGAGLFLNKPDNTQLLAAITKLVRVASPVGMVIMGYWSTARPGTLRLFGDLVSRSTYSALWAHAEAEGLVVTEAAWAAGQTTMFGEGDGATTFRLPDLRTEFPRFWYAGRNLGSRQDDEIKLHGHPARFQPEGGGSTDNTGGLALASDGSRQNQPAYTGALDDAVGHQIGGTGGTETRPRNVALMGCIYF